MWFRDGKTIEMNSKRRHDFSSFTHISIINTTTCARQGNTHQRMKIQERQFCARVQLIAEKAK